MNRKISEKSIEARLVRKVREAGGQALKWVSPGHAGVPDRIVMAPGGKLWFVETKAPGRELSPLQKIFKRDAEKLGFRYLKIDSAEQVDRFVELIKTGEGVV